MATSLSSDKRLGGGNEQVSDYYCHSCQAAFKSKEALCPQCKSEFVEEVEHPKPRPSDQQPVTSSSSTTSRRRDRGDMSDDEGDGGRGASRRRRGQRGREEGDLGETLGQYLVQLIQAREQLEDSENYTLPVIPPPPQFLDLMFRAPRVERLTPQSSSFAGALHTFVARLVEQLENSEGAPPAEQAKIDLLPAVQITREHIDQESECSICKEAYTLQDTGKSLPCGHLFHDFCILQWLKLRDTCPTCRFSLNQGKVVDT